MSRRISACGSGKAEKAREKSEVVVHAELRLSAQRAFLGRIHPEMRLIKAKFDGDWIVLSVILDREPSDTLSDDISEAATEIIANFWAPTKIKEKIDISVEPLVREDVLNEGWIYQRAE
jgi:hypothetical protein